jgi:hypothetical protein
MLRSIACGLWTEIDDFQINQILTFTQWYSPNIYLHSQISHSSSKLEAIILVNWNVYICENEKK